MGDPNVGEGSNCSQTTDLMELGNEGDTISHGPAPTTDRALHTDLPRNPPSRIVSPGVAPASLGRRGGPAVARGPGAAEGV